MNDGKTTKPRSSRDGGKNSTRPIISAVLSDGSIVETVLQPDETKTQLCVAKDNTWSMESEVKSGISLLVPYAPHNTLIEHEVLLLPSEPQEYESEEVLLDEIRSYIHRYVDVSEAFEEVASLYVLLTWVYDSFNELPYLRLRGDYGSGKTRALLVIGSICYKPLFASGASTVSPLFRMLDSIRGTLIIDEGDFRFSDEKSEIIKILNNGNARGFPVLRSEVTPKGEYNPHAYSVYGPKLVATRRQFHDRALESRCITEEMGRRDLRGDIPISLPPTQKDEARGLRNRLLLYRIRHGGQPIPIVAMADDRIEPRLSQVFAPLLSLLKDEAARARLLRQVYDYQDGLVSDRGMEMEAQVLEVIRDLLEAESSPLSVKEITNWFLDRFGEEYYRKVSAKRIGWVIRNGLQLKTTKSNGVYVIPPEEYPQLKRLFARYGLQDESTEGGQIEESKTA